MQVLTLALVLSAFVIAVQGMGPSLKVDEKWDKCNDDQDGGLELLGKLLNKSESYEMNGVSPCKKCDVWFLGTVDRAGDSEYEENEKKGCFDHRMKLSFAMVRNKCTCTISSPAGDVDGEIDTHWTQPRINTGLQICNKEKMVKFSNTEVKTEINEKTCDIQCLGTDKWQEKCEDGKKQGIFHATIKNSVEQLFPVQSTDTVKGDDGVMKALNCGVEQ